MEPFLDELDQEKQEEKRLYNENKRRAFLSSLADPLINRKSAGEFFLGRMSPERSFSKSMEPLNSLGEEQLKSQREKIKQLKEIKAKKAEKEQEFGYSSRLEELKSKLRIPKGYKEIARPDGSKELVPLQGTKFESKVNEEQAKEYTKMQSTLPKTQEAVDLIDDAFSSLTNYSKQSLGGTGPFATGFGAKKILSADTQNLEAKFRMIN